MVWVPPPAIILPKAPEIIRPSDPRFGFAASLPGLAGLSGKGGSATGGNASPPGITGTIGWWDASVFSSLTLSSSSITSAHDVSGTGNHLTVPSGTNPLYNATGFNTSFPTMVFSNANNSGLNKTGFALGTGNTLTVWIVGHDQASFSQNNCRAMSYAGGTGGQADDDNNASFFVGQVGTSIVQQINRNGSSASRTFTSDNTPHVLIATIDSSGVMTIYVDGVATVGSTLNASFGATGDFWLGQASPNHGNAEWHGVISDAGIARDFTNSTNVATAYAYFKAKWGL